MEQQMMIVMLSDLDKQDLKNSTVLQRVEQVFKQTFCKLRRCFTFIQPSESWKMPRFWKVMVKSLVGAVSMTCGQTARPAHAM